MPHGSLTPLGYRLRSVLVALRPNVIPRDSACTPSKQLQRPASYATKTLTRDHDGFTPRPQPASRTIARTFYGAALAPTNDDTPSASNYYDATLAPTDHELPSVINISDPPTPSKKPVSRRRLNKRTKFDYLGDELRRNGKGNVAPPIHERKRVNHFNHRDQHGKRVYAENRKRHASDYIPPLEHANVLSLPIILARHIHRTEEKDGSLDASWISPLSLKPDERRYLSSRGYGISDVKTWAAVVTESDVTVAADILQARVAFKGPRSIPLPIFAYMLRRPYISASALRILTTQAWDLFSELERGRSELSPDTVFIVFTRLARHARVVWPQALDLIASYLVRYMPNIRPNREDDDAKLSQAVTFMFNKAMYLISEPTAVAPFKDVNHQEAAVVRILAAMSEHDPPLQIDREGYRAVIRMQVANKKTDSERRWADLKALSWPPWKEDRTSMDSELGPEDGISKAGGTLRRMMEAGYGPQAWERVALLYTGWDVDGTPTTQTRSLLPTKVNADDEASLWAARIDTTRTIQEAWACYLAYEDTYAKPDEIVLLAILEKLHQEEKRQRKELEASHDKMLPTHAPPHKLLPGDAREIEPPPPSTHLYTYTRTTAPTVYQFYEQLCKQDVEIQDRCLAWLLTNSDTAQSGFEYLQTVQSRHPSIKAMLALKAGKDLQDVPPILFSAYIDFLTRFSTVITDRFTHRYNPVELYSQSMHLSHEHFNARHCLVQAIWLLKERKPRFLPTWNSALDALSHDKYYGKLHLAQMEHLEAINTKDPDSDHNAIIAYDMTQQVLHLLKEQHMDIDYNGFIALCRSTENVALSAWKILIRDLDSNRLRDDQDHPGTGSTPRPPAVTDAKELVRRRGADFFVEKHFKLLVGDTTHLNRMQEQSTKPALSRIPISAPGLPRLLTAPGPAMLHAYIRALGWCAAHDKCLATTKWMVEHQIELAAAQAKTRNGVNVMRRVVVALRVFLERSWLVRDAFEQEGLEHETKSVLLGRLEAPAEKGVVKEARSLVESVPAWGGWATDEEVRAYVRDVRFRRFLGEVVYD